MIERLAHTVMWSTTIGGLTAIVAAGSDDSRDVARCVAYVGAAACMSVAIAYASFLAAKGDAMRSAMLVANLIGVAMGCYAMTVFGWIVLDGGYTHSLGAAVALLVVCLAFEAGAIWHEFD